MRSRDPRALAAIAATVLLTTTGCSGDTAPTSGPAPSASPTSPSATTSGSTSSPSGSPTPDPAASPSVVPATGEVRDLESLSLTLPEDFAPTGSPGNGLLRQTGFGSSERFIVLFVSELAGQDLLDASLEELAARAVESSDTPLTREADRVVGGRDVYVLTGSDPVTGLTYEVGTGVGPKSVGLTFACEEDTPENRALIESVLATVQWKG